ncbi:MAG: 6-phosphogluconolactonase [Deltaproteobacteria bacterium]|nr:6-phosphogluconolactonase [Deltaproteobacteria bacterium]
MPERREIVIKEDANSLADAGADLIVSAALESVQRSGRFTLAISGGSTPRAMHRALGREPRLSKMPWSGTQIFWVDERCVPVEDPASNYGQAREDFLGGFPVTSGQIHPMPVDLPSEQGAEQYQTELSSIFTVNGYRFPDFDLILLGVGPDGHVASLFPGQEVLAEKEKWVATVKGGNPDVRRFTLTLPVLNEAHRIVFLVSGRSKALVVRTVLEGEAEHLPASMIAPRHGTVTWLLDREAASELSGAHSTR